MAGIACSLQSLRHHRVSRCQWWLLNTCVSQRDFTSQHCSCLGTIFKEPNFQASSTAKPIRCSCANQSYLRNDCPKPLIYVIETGKSYPSSKSAITSTRINLCLIVRIRQCSPLKTLAPTLIDAILAHTTSKVCQSNFQQARTFPTSVLENVRCD